MKKSMTTILTTFAMAFACNAVFADSIVAVYECKLKDGKEMEELQAANSKWLAFVHENASEDIETSVGTAVVGDQEIFLYVDSFPDLATWAAAQTALDSDAAAGLQDVLGEVAECSQNRLWKIEPTE